MELEATLKALREFFCFLKRLYEEVRLCRGQAGAVKGTGCAGATLAMGRWTRTGSLLGDLDLWSFRPLAITENLCGLLDTGDTSMNNQMKITECAFYWKTDI